MDYEENFDEFSGVGAATKKGGAFHDEDDFGDDEGFDFGDDTDMLGDDFKLLGDDEDFI